MRLIDLIVILILLAIAIALVVMDVQVTGELMRGLPL